MTQPSLRQPSWCPVRPIVSQGWGPPIPAMTFLTAVIVCAILGRAVLHGQTNRLAPYLATPPDVVDRMLALAKVGPGDVVYDLGCGDGRIVIAAARLGARGVGIDIDRALLTKARLQAEAAGVGDRATFLEQDALETDVSGATVVTLYLLSASNVRLRPRLTAQLPAGARIVAHNFNMGDWAPDVVQNFRDAGGATRTLYLWTTDGRARP